MDCLQASEVLSAAHDGADVAPALVAQAREHCAACPECAALLTTMQRVASVPPVRAPETLIARILETARAEADARVDAEAAAAQTAPVTGVVLPHEPVRPRTRRGPAWWKPQFAPIASAAAVVLVMSVVSTYALMQMTGSSQQAAEDTTIEIAASDGEVLAESARTDAGATFAPPAADTLNAAVASAPPYLTFRGTVWMRADGATPRDSELTSAGVVATDLGLPEGPRDREALSAANDPGAVYVRTPEGTLMRFARVTRTLGARTFALTTDATITMFGSWPTLPSRFPEPVNPDGSPTFVLQGFDDLGREAFVPTGARPADGFAIAPGTSPGDPAAGNPGWTWWQPID